MTTPKIPEPKGLNPVDMPWARAVTEFIRSERGNKRYVDSAIANLNSSAAGIFTAIEKQQEQIAAVGEATGVAEDITVGVPSAPILLSSLGTVTATWDGTYVEDELVEDTQPDPARIGYIITEASLTDMPPFVPPVDDSEPEGDPDAEPEPVIDPFVPVGTPFHSGSTAFSAADVGANVGDTVYVRFRSFKADGTEGFVSAVSSTVVEGVKVPDLDSVIMDEITNAVDVANEAWDAASVAIKSSITQYAVGSSDTVAPTTGWSTSTPERVPGEFIWMRTVLTYGDDSTSTTNPVLVTGNTGAEGTPGSDGSDGTDGAPGAPGKGIASSDVTYQAGTSGTSAPTGSWLTTVPSVSAGQFLWTRTVITFTDGATTTAYSVGRQGVNGAPGSDGADGAPGAPGAPGQTGVGVSSITNYYQKTSAAASAPAVPTTMTPPVAWTTTEPGYSVNTVLWSVTRVVYTNSTFAYSPVSKVSAYTAAAEAQVTADGKNRIYIQVATPVSDKPFVQGDLWYTIDPENTSRINGVKIWNGTIWADYQIVADSVIVPGSINGGTLIQDGTVTSTKVMMDEGFAEKFWANEANFGKVTGAIIDGHTITAENIASNTLTANEFIAEVMNGQTIRGAYVEAPVIASSPNLGQGANALNDPNLTSAINTAWVISGWTGDTTVASQTDRLVWDQTVNRTYPWTGTARMRGDATAVLRTAPLTLTTGSVLRNHTRNNYSLASRTLNNPYTYTSSDWPIFPQMEQTWQAVGMAPIAAATSKTSYLTNSANIPIVAGETWQASIHHTGLTALTAKYVTSAKVQLINASTSAVLWERVLEQGELIAGSPIEAVYLAPANVTAKLRIAATYTGAGGGLTRVINAGGFHRTDFSNPENTPSWFGNVGGSTLFPYNLTPFGGSPQPTWRGPWVSENNTSTLADRMTMFDRAGVDWRITSARFSKVTPEAGYRLDNNSGLQLFDDNGAMTGQLNGESNFLAGTFATNASGQRVQLDSQRVVWYDSFGTQVVELNGDDVLTLYRNSVPDYQPLIQYDSSPTGLPSEMVTAWYEQRGKLIHVEIEFVRTSAGSPSGNVTFLLPKPMATQTLKNIGSGMFVLGNSGTGYYVTTRFAGGDRISANFVTASGSAMASGLNLNATYPTSAAHTTGTTLFMSGDYITT